MGCSQPRDKEVKVAFDSNEQAALHRSYDNMLQSSQDKHHLTENAFVQLFKENTTFGSKLFRWMLQNSESNQVTFEVFIASLELLLKEQLDYYLVQYHFRTFEKVEIMALISLDNRDIDRDLFERLTISYSQALIFMKEVLSIFFVGKEAKENLDDIASKVLVTGLFGPNASMDYISFISALKAQLPFINKIIKQYFHGKFLDKAVNIKLPALNSASHILNDQLLGLFYLSHSAFQSIEKLTLLYSTASSKSDFETLSKALLNYESPSLIVIKHLERFDQEEGAQSDAHYIFGGYCSTPWRNQPANTGDSNSYVFSLLPKFRNFFTPFGEGGRSYAYISTEQKPNAPKGIGFGGDNYKTFRIWLDEDLYGKSYVEAEDRTFEKGYLLDHYVKKLKVQHIEVWGLGSEHYIQSQEVLRQTELAQYNFKYLYLYLLNSICYLA